jgi:hypothetical protein
MSSLHSSFLCGLFRELSDIESQKYPTVLFFLYVGLIFLSALYPILSILYKLTLYWRFLIFTLKKRRRWKDVGILDQAYYFVENPSLLYSICHFVIFTCATLKCQ